jgi:Ni,Fe-hydrogenase III large subunit
MMRLEHQLVLKPHHRALVAMAAAHGVDDASKLAEPVCDPAGHAHSWQTVGTCSRRCAVPIRAAE